MTTDKPAAPDALQTLQKIRDLEEYAASADVHAHKLRGLLARAARSPFWLMPTFDKDGTVVIDVRSPDDGRVLERFTGVPAACYWEAYNLHVPQILERAAAQAEASLGTLAEKLNSDIAELERQLASAKSTLRRYMAGGKKPAPVAGEKEGT